MTPKTNNLLRYPVDPDGNLEHYPSLAHGYRAAEQRWQHNRAFETTLTMVEIKRGRSAAYVVWRATDGRLYPMFLSDLGDLLTAKVIDRGVVHGTWHVRKAGHNYGLALAA
ncbi:hypothetical protein [Catellatospora tritici]|uniref:hypothetical protein n=1 Tax=Catellatospora tritici TaxID=2851566 RepID=UPI001C2CDF23|nr:hypothetical protein [Catellatospora tritici]MBV1853105.1 hypothetical protein [Catellatospora tritici]